MKDASVKGSLHVMIWHTVQTLADLFTCAIFSSTINLLLTKPSNMQVEL